MSFSKGKGDMGWVAWYKAGNVGLGDRIYKASHGMAILHTFESHDYNFV